jgi:catechol 2,3-dioxygenase-like lactoylglutathione lyase family enzyme
MTTRLASLGRTTLLVRSYDEALAFYRDKLGFDVLHDATGPNGQRYLHIGLAGQPGTPPVGLWLLEAVGLDAALVGCQAGRHPFLTLYADDCRSTTRALAARGVEIRREPATADGATFAHVADLYGNELLVVELHDDAGSGAPSGPSA